MPAFQGKGWLVGFSGTIQQKTRRTNRRDAFGQKHIPSAATERKCENGQSRNIADICPSALGILVVHRINLIPFEDAVHDRIVIHETKSSVDSETSVYSGNPV